MDLKLPHLGEGADSGTVVNLFVKEGDQVAKDQAVLELENEKAVATIPSTAAGTVTKVFVKAGDKLSVGQRILALSENGAPQAKPSSKSEPAPKSVQPAATPQPEPEPADAPAPAAGVKSGSAPAAAPSLRKLARELAIDLTKVRGSARGGRIVIEDIRAYIQRLQRLAAQPPSPASGQVAKPVPESSIFPSGVRFSKSRLVPSAR